MLIQPIYVRFQPSESKPEAIGLSIFIKLLEQEERYWIGEGHDTKLLISHLRKIFYDIYGWNRELIRGSAKVANRYEVKIVPDKSTVYPQKSSAGHVHHSNDQGVDHRKREVLVKEGDWLNPNAGTVPEIYANNNQQVILPSQWYCDMGHVLAGMDAANFPAPVAPIPDKLMWLRKILPIPSVDKNTDCSTWLGDISSSAGEFLFYKIKNRTAPNESEEQKLIDAGAPGADMLGNIDSIVIPMVYKLNANTGFSVSQIFRDYYYPGGYGHYFSLRRCQMFCKSVGLKNWNGTNFSNEKKWLRYQSRQLRTTTAFYISTRYSKPMAYIYAGLTWIGWYNRVIKVHQLLVIFLNALKGDIKNEPKL
jgi:hypothetical protein